MEKELIVQLEKLSNRVKMGSIKGFEINCDTVFNSSGALGIRWLVETKMHGKTIIGHGFATFERINDGHEHILLKLPQAVSILNDGLNEVDEMIKTGNEIRTNKPQGDSDESGRN